LRTGVLGGTFNPIHYGHLRPADEVREALDLDQVRIVPLSLPAHKTPDNIAPAEDRLEMVHLALEEFPHFVCDPIEIERGGISYTVDTLAELSEGSCRGHDLFFIIGADAFSFLESWREPLRLLGMVNFAVTLRGEQDAGEVMARVEENLKGLDKRAHFKSVGGNMFQYIDSERFIEFTSVNTLNISATMIREWIRSRRSLRKLLPPSVEGIIIRRGLYGWEE
jgi:nicotinate-nucleotide adenylyltransferase